MDIKEIEEIVSVVLAAMTRETAAGYELPKARVVPFCRRIAEGIEACGDNSLFNQDE